MWKVREWVNPFDENDPDFWIKIEHLGRYLFASNFLKGFNKKFNVIIDAGCGCGYGTNELCCYAKKIIGLDRDNDAIQYAEDTYKKQNIHFERFDFNKSLLIKMTKLGIRKADAIVAYEFIEHLDNPAKTLKEFHSILGCHGYLLLSVPNSKFEAVSEDGKPKNNFHKQLFTLEKIHKTLNENGFSVEKVYGQSMTNELLKKESKLARKKKISRRSSNIKKLHTKDVIRYFANMFAIPDQIDLDKSYSFVLTSKKAK